MGTSLSGQGESLPFPVCATLTLMVFPSPIGISDFKQLRESHAYYVDKTALIAQLIERRAQVVLFPRPRRFGKTLTMSLLRTFFEPGDEDRAWMFEDLDVWQCEACRQHFQKHPVIDLSFKGVKPGSWQQMFAGLQGVISDELARHLYLRESLIPEHAQDFQSMLDKEDNLALFVRSIALLSRWLEAHHGAKPVILLDEYDVPIQASYTYEYYDEAMRFFRDFITMTFKDNEHLYRGVLTGVLRVSKESMFSGANNIKVYSIFDEPYSSYFGFTQQQVDAILDQLDEPGAHEQVREWYNGYRFAGTTIYNPWSVLNYADNPGKLKAYWVHSGSDDVLRDLVLGRAAQVTKDIEALMNGEGIEQVVDDYMVLPDLYRDPSAVWNLLLLSGYLTVRNEELIRGRLHAELVIPNQEVQIMYEENIQNWIETAARAGKSGLTEMFDAMFSGDEQVFGLLLDDIVVSTFSYHDLGQPAPERVYQAFVLGMLVYLRETHRVESNRESGLGRYDVVLIPKPKGERLALGRRGRRMSGLSDEQARTGVVFELKVLDKRRNEQVEPALRGALEQVRARKYAKVLQDAGAEPIVAWGVVFDGKRVWVKREADGA